MQAQSRQDRLTLAHVVNMTNIDKLKHVMIYKSLCPECLEDGCQQIMCVVCKPNNPNDIKCIWRLDDEPHCTLKSHKWKVYLIMDNFVTHFLKHVGRVNHLVFQPCS